MAVKQHEWVEIEGLIGDGGLDQDAFAREAWPCIMSTCRWRHDTRPVRGLGVEDRVAESWLWIMKRWSDVESARSPVGMAVRIAKLACYDIEAKATGRTVTMRGKRVRVKGTNDFVELDALVGAPSDGRDFEVAVSYVRRSRLLGPLLQAIVREELALVGSARALFVKYECWANRYARDPHFRQGLETV